LLDGEMPHDLVEEAADAGVALLPGIGDLDPTCTCDAWELPCRHAAALCYQVAWLLDADPFVLLLLRGRSRDELLDQLQSRSAPVVASVDAVGVATRSLPRSSDLPDVPGLPAKVRVDELAVTGIEPPAGFAPTTLQLLVLDAARRARALLRALLQGTPEPDHLDEWQDAVRLAAEFPELTTPLSEATGRAADLALGIQAWRYGGAPGLDVLEHTWSPEPAELARARAELMAADEDLDVRTQRNRLLLGETAQLRLDHHGRWHPYRMIDGAWTPSAPPSADPLTAVEW